MLAFMSIYSLHLPFIQVRKYPSSSTIKKIPVVELLRESASGSETTGSLPISILSQKGKNSGLGRKGLKPMKNIQHKCVLVLTLIHMWLPFSLSLTHSYLKTPKRKNSLMLFQGKASKKFRNFIERDFFFLSLSPANLLC